jgi:hypothetical protein
MLGLGTSSHFCVFHSRNYTYIAVQLGKVCSFLSWHLELGTPRELSKYCPVPEIYRETLSWKQLKQL